MSFSMLNSQWCELSGQNASNKQDQKVSEWDRYIETMTICHNSWNDYLFFFSLHIVAIDVGCKCFIFGIVNLVDEHAKKMIIADVTLST